jgi:CoA:oxalate CoA-transferase
MLEGYRVLDFTQYVAGPTCTRLLAEMGAQVIKIEAGPRGDRMRDVELTAAGGSAVFFQHNHSKKSVSLDFTNPRARELMRELAGRVDVLVENFSPGVITRLGMDYSVTRKLNPRLIMCSISLAGQTGPLSTKPGYDYIGQAYAGVTGLTGERDRGPCVTQIAIGDTSTGVAAAMAVVTALLHRERTGEGQYIDASILDTYFHMHDSYVALVSLRPGHEPARSGGLNNSHAPAGVFKVRDEFITLVVMPHQWPQLVKAIGAPELQDDPRFSSDESRVANHEALRAIIERWLDLFPTSAAALQALERERVPCAPVLSLSQAIGHPHLADRGTVRQVSDPAIGSFAIPGMPVRLSAWPQRSDLSAPRLGQHNEEVFGGILGLSSKEIAELYADKVLVREDRAKRDI